MTLQRFKISQPWIYYDFIVWIDSYEYDGNK